MAEPAQRDRKFIGLESVPLTPRGKWRRALNAAGFALTELASVTGASGSPLVIGSDIAHGSAAGPTESVGTATPEGAVTAPIGSTFRRTDGGAGTSFYVKESGAGNTGWVGK